VIDPNRTLLGKWASPLNRVRVYQTAEGLDVETHEHFEVANTRVFYEDVQLVTIHREYGTLYLMLTGLFSFGFLMLFAYMATLGEAGIIAGSVIFIMIGLPFTVAFLTRAFWGVDVVTVFGRRSKATLRFRFRKRHSREVYGKICALVRAAQRVTFAPPAAGSVANATPAESPAPPIPDSVLLPPPEQ